MPPGAADRRSAKRTAGREIGLGTAERRNALVRERKASAREEPYRAQLILSRQLSGLSFMPVSTLSDLCIADAKRQLAEHRCCLGQFAIQRQVFRRSPIRHADDRIIAEAGEIIALRLARRC